MTETSATDMIIENIHHVRGRVATAAARSGRPADDVTIVAVSKTVPLERIEVAYHVGLKHFGENRVQEARGKITALRLPLIKWHLIGHLQSNKATRAVELFASVQSVDSIHLAEALDRHAAARERTLPVLLEVNVSGEPSKYGFTPDALRQAISRLQQLQHLRIEGLMTIAPLSQNPEDARPVFRGLRDLRDELRDRAPNIAWQHLSMGMTDDFEVAIEEGATIIRVGRAIFGERA
jgi:pyridoxal phosphate enzyme (YggS family)